MHNEDITVTQENPAIAQTKQLRKDLDAILQNLLRDSDKNFTCERAPDHHVRSSRERSIAVARLQEAIMMLGLDLKAINEENPRPRASPEANARAAYDRYGCTVGWENFRGDPMPEWDELGETIQKAWIAAANPPSDGSNPYPQSYNPESPVIEPTADGLKL